MPSSTPLRQRPYPLESDTPDVASDIHNLALNLDTSPVVGQGVLSARPASGVAGNRYYVTGDPTPINNGIEWYDTGAGWVRPGFGRGPLATRSGNANLTANVGDLVVAISGVTVTLPTPTAPDQIVGVFAASSVTGSNPVTVSAGANTIYGGGPTSASALTLGQPDSFMILQSLSTNQWLVIAGEQDTGWVALTPATHWSASAGAYAPAIRLVGNMVEASGALTGDGSSPTPINTLPAAFRPAATVSFFAGNCNITPAGVFTSGSSTACYLNGLRYRLS
jgi:hypothetical protein